MQGLYEGQSPLVVDFDIPCRGYTEWLKLYAFPKSIAKLNYRIENIVCTYRYSIFSYNYPALFYQLLSLFFPFVSVILSSVTAIQLKKSKSLIS